MASATVTKKSKVPATKKAKPQSKATVGKKMKKTEAWFDKELKDIVQEEKEEEVEDGEEIDIKDLPIIPLSVGNKSKLEKIAIAHQPTAEDQSTVVYLGHLPYGFEEFQMKEFFNQFGEVQRSYLSRSPKTGRNRGYGFIEFLHPEIAQIVADTMHDYLLFKKRLVCRVVPVGSALRIQWQTGPAPERTPFTAQRRAAARYNSQDKTKIAPKLVSLEARKKKKLARLGIDYQYDGYTTLVNKMNGTEAEGKQSDEKTEKAAEKPAEKRKRVAEEAEWEKRKQTKVATQEKTAQQKKEEKKQQSKEKTKERKKTQKQ